MFLSKKYLLISLSIFIYSITSAQNHIYINNSGQENTFPSFQDAVDGASNGDFIHLSNTDIVVGNVTISSKDLTILPETIGEEIDYGGVMNINYSNVTIIGFAGGDINFSFGSSGDTINIISSTIDGFNAHGNYTVNIYDSEISGNVTISSGSVIASNINGSLNIEYNNYTDETIKILANQMNYLYINNSYKKFEIRNNYISSNDNGTFYTYDRGIYINSILNDNYDFIIANNSIYSFYQPIYFRNSFPDLNSIKIFNNYLKTTNNYNAVNFYNTQDNIIIDNNIYYNDNFPFCNRTYYGENNTNSNISMDENGLVGSPTLNSNNGSAEAIYLDIDGSVNDIGIEGGPYSIRNYYFENDSLGKARIIDIDLPSEMFYGDSLSPIIIRSKGIHINE